MCLIIVIRVLCKMDEYFFGIQNGLQKLFMMLTVFRWVFEKGTPLVFMAGNIRINIVKERCEIMLLNQKGIKITEKEQEEFIWNGQN